MRVLANILWIVFALSMIVSGVIGLFIPLDVLFSFSFFLPVALIIGGISGIFYYFAHREYYVANLLLMDGIFNLIFAFIFILGGLEFTSAVIVYFIAFMTLFKGILGCSYAINLHKESFKEWIWILLFSILNIIIALIFILYPAVGGITIGIMISLLILFFGVVCLVSWFGFRKILA